MKVQVIEKIKVSDNCIKVLPVSVIYCIRYRKIMSQLKSNVS